MIHPQQAPREGSRAGLGLGGNETLIPYMHPAVALASRSPLQAVHFYPRSMHPNGQTLQPCTNSYTAAPAGCLQGKTGLAARAPSAGTAAGVPMHDPLS